MAGKEQKETVEQFLSRGGRIKEVDIAARTQVSPKKEFTIVTQGQRERKMFGRRSKY